MRARRPLFTWRAVAWTVLLACAGTAHAAHPFLTEDPGTQGTGRLELELGFAAGSADPANGGNAAVFAPQLSVGVTPTLDFIGQGFWQRQSQPGGMTLFGGSDIVADVKWRFFESDTWSFGVRGGLDLPTGDPDTGLGAGSVGAHVIGIAGLALGEWSVYANAAYARTRAAGARRNAGFFSIALTNTDTAPWQTFIEAATYSNPDPANGRWPAIARTGLIYALDTWLSVDVGFQTRLTASAPRAVWLAGATLRW